MKLKAALICLFLNVGCATVPDYDWPEAPTEAEFAAASEAYDREIRKAACDLMVDKSACPKMLARRGE